MTPAVDLSGNKYITLEPFAEVFGDAAQQLEAEYTSGEALGDPAIPVFGAKLGYRYFDFGAADNPETAEKYGLTTTEVRYRREIASSMFRRMIELDIATLQPDSRQEYERQQYWYKQVPRLTFNEILTFMGYRVLSSLQLDEYQPDVSRALQPMPDNWHETLEPAFGQDAFESGGYYAYPGKFEKRLQPANLETMLARAKRAVSVFRAISEYFGIDYLNHSSQITMSIHANRGNGYELLHDLRTPDGRKFARYAVEGMLGAIGAATILHSTSRQQLAPSSCDRFVIGAGINRHTTLRVKQQSFEWLVGNGELESLAAMSVIMLSGARHGYVNRGSSLDVETTVTERPWFEPGENFVKPRDYYIMRVLQNADFAENGVPQLEKNNIMLRNPWALHTIYALCGIPELPGRVSRDTVDYSSTLNGLLATICQQSNNQLRCEPAQLRDWLQNVDHPELRRLISTDQDAIQMANAVTERLQRVTGTQTYEISGRTLPIEVSIGTLPALINDFQYLESLSGFTDETRSLVAEYLRQRIQRRQTPRRLNLLHLFGLRRIPEELQPLLRPVR